MAPRRSGALLALLVAGPLYAAARGSPAPPFSAMVRSAGLLDGDFVEFFVGGRRLNVSTGPGLNVAVLDGAGTLLSSASFDVQDSAAGRRFSALAEGLSAGAVVLAAWRGSYSEELVALQGASFSAALARLGATAMGSIRPRGSYALIGVRGAGALAEQVKAPGQGFAAVASLCSERGMPGFDIEVQGVGPVDGNLATFSVAGRVLDVRTRRGLNVVALDSAGAVLATHAFAPHAEGAEQLAAALAALPIGTLLLVGGRGDGLDRLTGEARAALAEVGATVLDRLPSGASYALVGMKGAAALAEAWAPPGHRPARGRARYGGPDTVAGGQALAETVVTDRDGLDVAPRRLARAPDVASNRKPLCPARTREPPVNGWLSKGQLALDIGCQYSLFESANAAKCLAGGWMVLLGGSNMDLMGITLANMLAPEAIMPARDGASEGGYTVMDIIIKDRAVVYRHRMNHKACVWNHDYYCQVAVNEAVAAAPTPPSGGTRITLVSARFADEARIAMTAVKVAAHHWAEVPMAIVLQVGTWDIYCAALRMEWCPRGDVLKSKLTREQWLQKFKQEVALVVSSMAELCVPGGRAGKFGCVVGTMTFQANGFLERKNLLFETYNAAIREAVRANQSDTLRVVDFWGLGKGAPNEELVGHGSPALNLWNWQVMLSGMCGPEYAAEGTVARFEGELCSGDQVKPLKDGVWKSCPDYWKACPKNGGKHWRCDLYECTISMPCKLVASVDTSPPVDDVGMCGRQLSVDFAAASHVRGQVEVCRAIWCAQDLEWLPAVVAFALAVLVYAVGHRHELVPLVRRSWRQCRGGSADAGTAKVPAGANALWGDCSAEDGEGGRLLGLWSGGFGAENKNKATSQETSGVEAAGKQPALAPQAEAEQKPTPAVAPEGLSKAEGSTQDPTAKPAARDGEAAAGRGAATAGDKFPLGLARYCASLHVVAGHLYAGGLTPNVYFFGWGFTWVPWFFMLSGFVLFAAHLRQPKQEGVFEYVIRRSMAIYPLYAVSLLIAFYIARRSGHVPDWQVLVVQSFLLQAWWPAWTEHALQSHCWFLSSMVVYWLLFRPLAACLQPLALRGTVALLLALFALPWLVVLVPAAMHQSLVWYQEHMWAESGSWVDFLVVFLKFHPLCYLHVFVLGMLLAKLRLLLDERAMASKSLARWSAALEFVAPAGYGGLLLVFCVPAMRPWAHKLSARLSVLLPFQAAVLFGLAGLPSLPLPVVASVASRFNFLESYSYSVYVFQFIAHSFWPRGGKLSMPWFYLFLASSAYLASTLIQQPAQRWWGSNPRARLLIPVLLAGWLGALTLLPVTNTNSDIPARVRLDARTVDVRLPLMDVESREGCLMNPSLAVQDGRVLVAARRHKKERTQHNGWRNGSAVLVVDDIWRSQVLLGSAGLDPAGWAAWPTTGVVPFDATLSPWYGLRTPEGRRWDRVCARETSVPNNHTVMRQVVTGPEDAKVFDFNGKVAVAFSSLPPLGQQGCPVGEEVSQMYLAPDVHEAGIQSDVAERLMCGRTAVPEKNWIPFTYKGRLHFVYSPLPHEIVVAGEDGSCETAYTTDFVPLMALRRANLALAVRGSGQAVLVDDPEATPNLPRPHYLAVLHVVDERTHQYAHFAYRFSDQPPFNILQVSSQLPLVPATPVEGGGAFAFVSGLALQSGTVAITYGAGDRDARALVLTLSRLDEMFACKGPHPML